MKVETLILKNLLLSEEYVRKALPFVKDEYFPDLEERVLFDTINKYFQQYSAVPTKEALLIEIGDNKSLSDEQYKNTQTIITSLDDEVSELDWVLDTTEKWCKERAIYLALMESIKIAEGNDGDKSPDAIPSILSELCLYHLTTTSDTITLKTMKTGMNLTTELKTRSPLTLNYLTRLQKVGP